MARLAARLHCIVWLLLVSLCHSGDIENELYRKAKVSKNLSHLTQDTLDEFLLSPPEPYVLILFHVGTCHICRETLPELDAAAAEWQEKDVRIAVGHVECTGNQEYWRRRLGFEGFPHLLLWHRADGNKDAGSDKIKGLLDVVNAPKNSPLRRSFKVSGSEKEVVAASRNAKMAAAKDELRLTGLGKTADIDKVELDDFTARVKVGGAGELIWYPLEVLSTSEGQPLMPFARPSLPIHYKPHSWKRPALQDFAERLMRPPVTPLQDLQQLSEQMKDEKLAGFILCADSQDQSSTFAALAKKWQDKHRAYHAASPAACPVAGDKRPQIVVYSPPHQQWGATGSPPPAAYVARADVAATTDLAVLTTWFEEHRFPGMYNMEYDNFHIILNANRGTAMVALNDRKKTEMRKIEKEIRDVTQPVAASSAGHAEVYATSESSTYWGIVDGTLNGLDAFGVQGHDLPRIVIFDSGGQWVEDAVDLPVWGLRDALHKVPTMIKYGNGPWGLVLKHVYKPWLRADHAAAAMGGTPMRAALVGGIVLGFGMIAHKLGQGVQWMFSGILGSDGELDAKQKSS